MSKAIEALDSGQGDIGNGSGRSKTDNGAKDLLGVPRSGHRKSFMEEESAKEKARVTLLKQCSAILKQTEQKHNKESLHRLFQDEASYNFIFFTNTLILNSSS